MATAREQMLAGKLYQANDPELVAARQRAKVLCHRYNQQPLELNQAVLAELLGYSITAYIEAPLRCDYGTNIRLGQNSYANYNLTILDCASVRIGAGTTIGSRQRDNARCARGRSGRRQSVLGVAAVRMSTGNRQQLHLLVFSACRQEWSCFLQQFAFAGWRATQRGGGQPVRLLPYLAVRCVAPAPAGRLVCRRRQAEISNQKLP